jgi:hypothetical protein
MHSCRLKNKDDPIQMIPRIQPPYLVKIKTIAFYLAKILALAVIYQLAARVGLKMAYVQPNTSPVWPPVGIALAALLIPSLCSNGLKFVPGITRGKCIRRYWCIRGRSPGIKQFSMYACLELSA